MAEGGHFNRLRKVLECSICLELFDDPKMLRCTHEFCKRCLEDVVTFRKDGSAIITCPLRCDKGTVLNNNQTVHDLAASYTTKNMLDTVKTDDPEAESTSTDAICKVKKTCTKPISVFCCDKIMCKSCYNCHVESSENTTKHRKFNLSFNRKENKLMVTCDRHSTDCSHLCVDYNSCACFVCNGITITNTTKRFQ